MTPKRWRRDTIKTGACHPDRRRRSGATEEEWRDPEDASSANLIQGVLFENLGTGIFLLFALRVRSALAFGRAVLILFLLTRHLRFGACAFSLP